MDQETDEQKNNDDILRKISSGIYKIAEKRKGRSQIWCVFGEIQKEDGSYVQDLVYCQECHHLLKFNGKQTSNLVRHKCFSKRRHELEEDSSNAQEGQEHERSGKKYKFVGFSLKQLGQKEKHSVIEACSQWEKEENRPVASFLDNEGFQKLVHTFIRLGAKHGENVDLQHIFTDKTTTTNAQLSYSTVSQESSTNIKQDLERSSDDDNNQSCMEFNNENDSDMEFLPYSTDPVGQASISRTLNTPLSTSQETSSDTTCKTPKRNLEPAKLYIRKMPRIEEKRSSCDERSNDARLQHAPYNEQPKQLPPPPPPPTPLSQTSPAPVGSSVVDKAADDGCRIFGDHIAFKMKQYSVRTRNIAQHHINNILFDADMGKYEVNSE